MMMIIFCVIIQIRDWPEKAIQKKEWKAMGDLCPGVGQHRLEKTQFQLPVINIVFQPFEIDNRLVSAS